MATKQKPKVGNKHKLALAALILLVVGVMIVKNCRTYQEENGISQTRDLVTMAINNLKTPAPIEAKTGDVYFPQAKLYLPAEQNKDDLWLVYSYFKDDSADVLDFSISNRMVIGQLESKLYSAQTQKQLFDQIPRLQACARGVKVSFEPLKPDEIGAQLQYSGTLQNGKTLYLYAEKTCPEIGPTVDTLKNLQSY